ncbi:MAG TPA: hypothetical protein VGQ36_03225 [Thermoanaerobaculia bacterium]|jgi:hypothetical protein|nr:hypothetical protein [Thermoanaerobaculia bacterium]
MMIKRSLIFLAVIATLLNVAPDAMADKKDRSCLAVVAGSLEQPWKGGKDDAEKKFGSLDAPAFSAAAVLDLKFAIVFSKKVAEQFSAVHIVEFRVYTPQGHLYQSLSIPMTNDGRLSGERHHVPGYPDPMPVQVLQPIHRGGGHGMFAEVTLPVAGTSIVGSSLYGTWKAEAFVADEIAPCSQRASFTITQ